VSKKTELTFLMGLRLRIQFCLVLLFGFLRGWTQLVDADADAAQTIRLTLLVSLVLGLGLCNVLSFHLVGGCLGVHSFSPVSRC